MTHSIAALIALVFLVIFFRFYHRKNTQQVPGFWYSHVGALKTTTPSLRLTFANLPHWLFFLSLCCLVIAWLDPRVARQPPAAHGQTPPAAATEGLAIYLLLDQSGSMNRISPTDPLGPTKFERLKTATSTFIRERPNDLIGLIAFSRAATILAPLTRDHDEIRSQLLKLHPTTDPEQDGTGIGYAIFKTVNLITATRQFADTLNANGQVPYQIRDAVIVLVTDGFQSTNPLDKGKWMRTMGMEEAAQYAKANHIKLYLINMEPALSEERFAPHRRLLEHVTALTGGQFFFAPDPHDLQRIYADIDRMELSRVPALDRLTLPAAPPPRQLYALFLYGGLFALGSAIILSTTFLRRVP
jgi:Ca-activated chloride channel family protein